MSDKYAMTHATGAPVADHLNTMTAGTREHNRSAARIGAQPDAGDSERGNTALMGISFKGYRAIARLLVGAGAAVDARNFMGQIALTTAALFGQEEIIDLLERAPTHRLRTRTGIQPYL